MLLSNRVTWLPSMGALLRTRAVVHSAYRVHVVERRNVVSDDGLFLPVFRRVGGLARPVVTVLLEGRARIRALGTERWLDAGDVSLIEAKASIEMRQEPPYLSIAMEWDGDLLSGVRPRGFKTYKIDGRSARRLRELAASFPAGDDGMRAAAEATLSVVEVLRARGAPLTVPARERLIEPSVPRMQRVGLALDRVLSHLEGRPMAVDLEVALGVGPRQVNRLVAEYNARYGFNAAGWRDTRKRRQLLMGATLMTARGAVAERVAAAVGYGSARAFHHALAAAGLPPPSRIAETVAALR